MRISKKSGAIIPKPDRSHLTYINRTKQREPGIYDTRGDLVLEKTYKGEDFKIGNSCYRSVGFEATTKVRKEIKWANILSRSNAINNYLIR